MKFHVLILAFSFAAATVFGQDNSNPSVGDGILLAQAPVTSINDKGAVQQQPPAGDEIVSVPLKQGATPRNTPGKAEAATTTLLKLVLDGGWAMIPLGVLSVVTVMLVLVYWITLRRSAILTTHYMNTADVLLKKRDYLGLLAISSRHSEVVARIVQRTLDFATKNPTASYDVVKDIAETEGSSQASSLLHRVTYLADIGVLAPMIGLLGTVIGIIRAFGELGKEGATTNRDILMASGVSEALVATASGLILGIVAMAAYGYFRNRVQSLVSDLEIASAHILGLIALNYNKKREQSRVAVDEELF